MTFPDPPPSGDLGPNPSPEEVLQRGRELRQWQAETRARLAEFEAAAERVIADTARNGLTTEEAEGIARIRSEIATLKVMSAWIDESHELGDQIVREKGYEP